MRTLQKSVFSGLILTLLSLLLSIAGEAQLTLYHYDRPDSKAPLSTFSSHFFPDQRGSLEVSTIGNMYKGLRKGKEVADTSQIFTEYNESPESYLEYGTRLTFRFRLNLKWSMVMKAAYLAKSMSYYTKGNPELKTDQIQGVSDAQVQFNYTLRQYQRQFVYLFFGVSVPVGNNPKNGSNQEFLSNNYLMPISTGTWDPFMGATFFQQFRNASIGVQAFFRQYNGENFYNYSFGGYSSIEGWYAYKIMPRLSSSLKVDFVRQGVIDGEYANYDRWQSPFNHPINTSQGRISIGSGFNYHYKISRYSGFRISVDAKIPVYQNSQAIQFNQTIGGVFGVSYEF